MPFRDALGTFWAAVNVGSSDNAPAGQIRDHQVDDIFGTSDAGIKPHLGKLRCLVNLGQPR
jgi:hypothetical protein